MSRAIALTRPAQRSVRTGPGLTATRLIPCPAILARERQLQILSGGIRGTRRDLPIGGLHPVIANEIDNPAAALPNHDRQDVAQAAHVAHELELKSLCPIR